MISGSNGRTGLSFTHIGAALSAALATALSWSFHPLPIGPHGIDAGWQWIVNVAAEKGWAWGSELVFTYGPLGWLIAPQDVGIHLFLAAVFTLALQATILWILLRRLFAAAENPALLSGASVFFFSLLWLFGTAVGRRPEGTIVLVMLLLCLDALDAGCSSSAAMAGFLTSLCLLIKASLGVSCLALAGLAFLVALRRKEWRLVGFGGVAALLNLMILLPVIFEGRPAFIEWVSRSLEVIGGYSTAGSILGPKWALLGSLLLLLLFLISLGILSLRQQQFRLVALLLLIPLLISFRLAFVRQDGHQFLYLPVLISCVGFLALRGGVGMGLGCTGAAVGAVLMASGAGALPFSPAQAPAVVVRNVMKAVSWKWALHPGRNRRKLLAQSRENLRALKIDPGWSRRIRESGETVSVIPWEALYAPANALPLQPLRCTQLYSGYTAKLDQWTAAAFEGEGAPGWVLDDFAPVGKRRALLDTPATWRMIWENYSLKAFDRERGLLLLKKLPRPRAGRWVDLGSTEMMPGYGGVNVPESEGLVFAEIKAPLNLLGRLNGRFFRVPMLLAVFHREDATKTWTRLIAATAVNGILISEFPRDFEGYSALWGARGDLPVRRMEIVGPGLPYYAKKFSFRWRAWMEEK